MPIRGNNSALGTSSGLFEPKYLERLRTGDTGKVGLRNEQQLDQSIGSQESESWRFDPLGYPLQSTQQIPLDWSLFSNHTFFNSAEANVNSAFDVLINEYPFDGTVDEMVGFIDGLTGFEKYVYDSLPKSTGYLEFSGSADASGGMYVSTADSRGSFSTTLAREPDGRAVIDPREKSFTVDMKLHVPAGIDLDVATVCQKRQSDSFGFGLFVSESLSASDTYTMVGIVTSGSNRLSASFDFPRGEFSHVGMMYDRTPGVNRVYILSGTATVASSSQSISMGDFGTESRPLLIGSGSTLSTPGADPDFVPLQTLSASMDDFRFWHGVRTKSQLELGLYDTVFPDDDLRLLYRFNEPSGSYTSNDVVLDSSGNSLHASIVNFSDSLATSHRSQRAGSSPLVLERSELSPVLFPTFDDVVDLNTDLLTSASQYDANNPGLITKLIPRHYLLEASQLEGFSDVEANTADPYSYDESPAIPGSGKLGSPQIISAFLFTLAKQFDEYKIFLDHFSKLLHVSYDSYEGVSDQLVTFFAKYFGFDLPPTLFSNISLKQYSEGGEVTVTRKAPRNSVKFVTAQIIRRILVNMPEIVRTRGTRHSIEVIMRCMGINPYSSWRIREFGGAAIKDMTPTRRRMTEVRSMLDFSGSLSDTPGSTDAQGFYASLPHFSSPFLSGSRVEVGAPTPAGTFVNKTEFFPHGISDDPNDGLFTSGSYTVEGLVKFPPVLVHDDSQSLYRLHTTGSAQEHSVLANLVAQQEDVTLDRDASLNLFVRSANSTTDTSLLHLSLTDVNVFDGDPWYVSFGRKGVESDQPVSASYFLRAGKITARDRVQLSSGSQVFESNSGGDLFSLVTSTANASGSFLVVGEQAISTGAGLYGLGDTTAVTSSLAQVTTFSGKVAELRFWSKALDDAEWLEHVRNPRSVGVRDPLVNYNFVTDRTGSFERLRLDLSTDQPTTASDTSGALQLVDFSQNFEDTTVAGLEASVQVIDPERFDFTMIEPKFDERSAENKVRVRGWQDPENIELYGGTVAPANEVRHPAESPQDDTRLSIEMSMVKALDEDIVNVMATLGAIERAIGGPEMLFTRSYPELEKLRKVYFQRLTGRVNYSRFLEIYKWFDDSLEFFVSKLLPAKTDFLGVNFVVESHMLERSKVSYAFYTQYLDNRGRAADFQEPDGPDELDAIAE